MGCSGCGRNSNRKPTKKINNLTKEERIAYLNKLEKKAIRKRMMAKRKKKKKK